MLLRWVILPIIALLIIGGFIGFVLWAVFSGIQIPQEKRKEE